MDLEVAEEGVGAEEGEGFVDGVVRGVAAVDCGGGFAGGEGGESLRGAAGAGAEGEEGDVGCILCVSCGLFRGGWFGRTWEGGSGYRWFVG